MGFLSFERAVEVEGKRSYLVLYFCVVVITKLGWWCYCFVLGVCVCVCVKNQIKKISVRIRPAVIVMADWALKTNLSIVYLSFIRYLD